MLKNKIRNILSLFIICSYILIYFYSSFVNNVERESIPKNLAILPKVFEIKMIEIVKGLPNPTEVKEYYKPEVNSVSLTYYYKYKDSNYINILISNINKNPYWMRVGNESTSNAFLSYCSKDYISLKIYKNIDEINTPHYFSIAIFFKEKSYCMTKFKV